MEIELILTHRCSLHCKQCYAVHNNTVMSEEVLSKAIEYIQDLVESNPDDEFGVNLVGGELGLVDHKWVLSIMDRILDTEGRDRITFEGRSNLVFDMTPEFIEMVKRCNHFGTSYDYKMRFNTKEQEDLWRKNIKTLQDNGVDLDCIMTINKDLMRDMSPNDIFKFMEDLHIHKYDLHRLFYPGGIFNKKEYDENIRPLNRDVDKWLLKVFLEYEKYKESHPNVSLETFEAVKDGLRGEYNYTHYRKCQKDCRTINPNGMVAQCTYTQGRPYFNLMTREKDMNLYNEIVKHEETPSTECQNCHLYRFCNGDCCWFPYDETGCPGLKMIYEYLLMKEGI